MPVETDLKPNQQLKIGGLFQFSDEEAGFQFDMAMKLAAENVQIPRDVDILATRIDYAKLKDEHWDVLVAFDEDFYMIEDSEAFVFRMQDFEESTSVAALQLRNIKTIAVIEDIDDMVFKTIDDVSVYGSEVTIERTFLEKNSVDSPLSFELGIVKFVVIPSGSISFMQSVLLRLAILVEESDGDHTPFILTFPKECLKLYMIADSSICDEECIDYIKRFRTHICLDMTSKINEDWRNNIWNPATTSEELIKEYSEEIDEGRNWNDENMNPRVPMVYDAVRWSIEAMYTICPDSEDKCSDEMCTLTK
eukprot:TRINITY_DN5169_c0_g1_i2.p1 TRINITY_DN5169_c0_g1~~TRINITY_DN5169_c0_g1_i2.p1  ORF type:complete len:307 (-),score=61.95 TRINITY_DN5169_c0_g1_i2:270-1190(-)